VVGILQLKDTAMIRLRKQNGRAVEGELLGAGQRSGRTQARWTTAREKLARVTNTRSSGKMLSTESLTSEAPPDAIKRARCSI